MTRHDRPALLGYADKLSVRAGESVAMKVSSTAGPCFTARLTRSISADPNPAGVGIVEEDASRWFAPVQCPSVEQAFHPGSCAITADEIDIEASETIEFSVIVWPTLRKPTRQSVLSCGAVSLHIDADGIPCLEVGAERVSTGVPLTLRRWTQLEACLSRTGLTIRQSGLDQAHARTAEAQHACTLPLTLVGSLMIAARKSGDARAEYFNGKIEAPNLVVDGDVAMAWNLADAMQATTVPGSPGPDLTLVNYPARAMTGSRWDGSFMCWSQQPEHYAAIHFHEDDIVDFDWATDFTFRVPEDMPSGAYVMRLSCGEHEDAIPLFVCSAPGRPTARLAVLVSTFTYAIYGNHARPDYHPDWQKRTEAQGAYPHNPANYSEYGLSTYNYHSDGSGICHASHKRPLFNLRPGYITFGASPCSGLRHFQADSHLLSWLHAKDIAYDLVADIDLHREGAAALQSYSLITTGTHPEYHTRETLDALTDYRDAGGHLAYLGGNGFYWRIALHTEDEGVLEIRRAEDGIRAWAADPGEYYNAFDGTYGGLWRRNGRAPQELVGVGFSAQGSFIGDPYRRLCFDTEHTWVFEGIDATVLGDYGFSGGGAAGFELDHIDYRLGTPENAVLLARSVTRENGFMLVPEEQLTHLTNLGGGTAAESMHADMVMIDYPGGGSVFSTGSITFCGSLPWNDFDNDISRLLENVFRRWLGG